MKKKAKPENQSPLHALLPGAKVNSGTGKIVVNVGISPETLVFNVGGVRFETYASTLHKQPHSPLANKEFLQKHFRPHSHEYFFDRDPDSFKIVLNYLRTGELHLPTVMCGPALKNELEFWGISDNIIERCCYSHYNAYNSMLESLNQLEYDRKGSLLSIEDISKGDGSNQRSKFKQTMSKTLNQPDSSIYAKIYGCLSLLLVAVSICSFLVETHPTFQVTKYVNEVISVFNTSSNATEQIITTKAKIVPHPVFNYLDLCCMIYFTLEYVLRIITSLKPVKYMRSLMGVIDILALLPDYVQFIMLATNPSLLHEEGANVITILRVTRVLRIFRLVRHVPGLWIFIYTLKASVKELLLLVAFLLVGMLIFASLIYYADDRETFTSIPHSFWWALITMTTVGYGDMYPVTSWGYVVGSMTAMSGLLVIGFSVPVLVNNFLMYYNHVQFALQDEKRKRKQECQKHTHPTFKKLDDNCNNNEACKVFTLKMAENL